MTEPWHTLREIVVQWIVFVGVWYALLYLALGALGEHHLIVYVLQLGVIVLFVFLVTRTVRIIAAARKRSA